MMAISSLCHRETRRSVRNLCREQLAFEECQSDVITVSLRDANHKRIPSIISATMARGGRLFRVYRIAPGVPTDGTDRKHAKTFNNTASDIIYQFSDFHVDVDLICPSPGLKYDTADCFHDLVLVIDRPSP